MRYYWPVVLVGLSPLLALCLVVALVQTVGSNAINPQGGGRGGGGVANHIGLGALFFAIYGWVLTTPLATALFLAMWWWRKAAMARAERKQLRIEQLMVLWWRREAAKAKGGEPGGPPSLSETPHD